MPCENSTAKFFIVAVSDQDVLSQSDLIVTRRLIAIFRYLGLNDARGWFVSSRLARSFVYHQAFLKTHDDDRDWTNCEKCSLIALDYNSSAWVFECHRKLINDVFIFVYLYFLQEYTVNLNRTIAKILKEFLHIPLNQNRTLIRKFSSESYLDFFSLLYENGSLKIISLFLFRRVRVKVLLTETFKIGVKSFGNITSAQVPWQYYEGSNFSQRIDRSKIKEKCLLILSGSPTHQDKKLTRRNVLLAKSLATRVTSFFDNFSIPIDVLAHPRDPVFAKILTQHKNFSIVPAKITEWNYQRVYAFPTNAIFSIPQDIKYEFIFDSSDTTEADALALYCSERGMLLNLI